MAQKKIQPIQTDITSGSTAPDASPTVKGIVQLAGDLGGTSAVPTVPGLAGKAPTFHTHAATDIASGVMATGRLGTGVASATTFLRGDSTWATPASGGGGSYNDPTIIVAAVSAPASWIAVADYLCDGTADQVEIQAAITTAKANGSPIALSPGTFNLSASINIAGFDNPDLGFAIILHGQGVNNTILSCASGVNGIALSNCCRVDIQSMQIAVNGTSIGITSTGAGTTFFRSFWNSTFKNLFFVGPYSSTHTGWAMKLGSPFRSTFENIEVSGTRNGIQLYTESALFNPGDCTFTRCFVEISGGSGVAWHLRGAVNADCTMNQVVFIMCEGICNGSAGTTGILLDGSGAGTANWNTFIGINLEQFAILVDIENGEGNTFDCNYIEARPSAGTIFKCAANAGNNRLSARNIYAGTPQTLINDANTTGMGNHFEHIKILADTGATMTVTKVASSIVFHNTVQSGGGTVPASFLS